MNDGRTHSAEKASPPSRQAPQHREAADDYAGVLARLNDDWRVIRDRDDVQWILQRRTRAGGTRGAEWRSVRYNCDAYALRASARALCGSAHSADLGALEERLPIPAAGQGIGGAWSFIHHGEHFRTLGQVHGWSISGRKRSRTARGRPRASWGMGRRGVAGAARADK